MPPVDSTLPWDSAESVQEFHAFNRRHTRYHEANAELVRHSVLHPGLTLLDLGAGLGDTGRAALAAMEGRGRVICVEPARAMRAAGARNFPGPQVEWHAAIPPECKADRILIGAGIWQMTPLGEQLARFRRHLRAGGALCFNLPALYLREPDAPGGGRDPLLLELPGRLRQGAPGIEPPPSWEPFPDLPGLEALLADAGFRSDRWEFAVRITQEAWRDWLKLPACSALMLPGLTAAERAARIDAAFADCDPDSWRQERWRGWTAWVD